MGRNSIELCGPIKGEPELRTTPAGTAVLRIFVDCGEELALAAVMTGEQAGSIGRNLRARTEVRVTGSLKAVRRRLKSGLTGIGYEVMADSIQVTNRTE